MLYYSVLLYSPTSALDDIAADANSYQPFKLLDNAVTKRIGAELDALKDEQEEGVCCTFTAIISSS